jgi:hypothetical protein
MYFADVSGVVERVYDVEFNGKLFPQFELKQRKEGFRTEITPVSGEGVKEGESITFQGRVFLDDRKTLKVKMEKLIMRNGQKVDGSASAKAGDVPKELSKKGPF